MLFNGEAMFGVVELSGQSHLGRCRVDQISQRASRLGAKCGYQESGAAILGWASRTRNERRSNPYLTNANIRIAIAGEVIALGGDHDSISAQDDDQNWIAEGYQSAGNEFLSRLDGTFALALWNAQCQKLVLMTDRRSDAQLFYRVQANQLVFASWLSLIAEPKQEIDRSSVNEFLRFLYIAAPRTIYDGYYRLEPGRYLLVSGGTVESHSLRQQNSPQPRESWRGSPDDALEKFQSHFEHAIERRIGRRRAGVFLSSGVDSATLMAGCHKLNPGQVEAFTVGFDSQELDETNAARAYAEHFGVPHTVFKLDNAAYRRGFESMAREYDQPFADPAGLPLTIVSNAVKDRVDVLTGGTGGDDLFGAPIPRHLSFSLAFSAKLPTTLRSTIATIIRNVGWGGLSQRAALFDFADPEELFITWSGWRKTELEQLLGERVDFSESGFYRMFKTHQHDDAQDLYDALGVFPPDDCRFEAAAPANIPIELPYHDLDLHAYVNHLPSAFRMQDGVTKVLLKRLFERYFPKELQLVKKHYFNMPLPSLLAHNRFEIVRENLARDVLIRHSLVDYERARPWVDRYVAGDDSLMFKVWALLVLHAWLESRN